MEIYMENSKALAILDMAIKINKKTPTSVMVRYYPNLNELDVIIYWSGWGSPDERYTAYDIPLDREPTENSEQEISADDMLRILEEIWAGRENG